VKKDNNAAKFVKLDIEPGMEVRRFEEASLSKKKVVRVSI